MNRLYAEPESRSSAHPGRASLLSLLNTPERSRTSNRRFRSPHLNTIANSCSPERRNVLSSHRVTQDGFRGQDSALPTSRHVSISSHERNSNPVFWEFQSRFLRLYQPPLRARATYYAMRREKTPQRQHDDLPPPCDQDRVHLCVFGGLARTTPPVATALPEVRPVDPKATLFVRGGRLRLATAGRRVKTLASAAPVPIPDELSQIGRAHV